MASSVTRRGQLVADEGGSLTLRRTINFIGAPVTAVDNAAQDRTDVTITATGGTTNVTFAADSGLPVFNVKDATYGAVGNGTTDDTAAIQAAIDAAEGAGSYATVFLPFGKYKITAPLTIDRPIRFQGEGCIPGDRPSNYNYAALGSVIWNASTSTDAIQFSPTTVAGVYPRGLGGMIFEDFGIDTPDPGLGSRVVTTDPTGWGPHSTGTGIAIAGGASHYGYYVRIRRVTVCRHYVGFNLNTDSATSEYGTGAMDVEWCNAFLCRTTGFDCRSVEARLDYCRAKNNDPEWGPTVDPRTAASFSGSNPVLASGTIGLETDTSTGSTLKYKVGDGATAYNSLSYATAGAGSFPANGTYGFRFGADGSQATNCLAITCEYGFHAASMNGFLQLIGCGCDSSRYPYYFSGITEPMMLASCWGVQSYWEPRTSTYPYGTGVGFTTGIGARLTGCVCKTGGTHLSANGGSISGGTFPVATLAGACLASGVYFGSALTRSSLTGRVIGCDLTGGVSGAASTSKGVGNIGVADW